MSTRLERVILDLEDRFSGGMVKAAASTALLNKELGSLSRDSVRTRRSISSDIDEPIGRVGKSSKESSSEVDRLSGRLGILADVAAILGPSLVPIAAVGIPAVAGLASQLGFAVLGAGTAVLAFQGIKDALKDLNAAGLNPTAANLDKAEQALDRLSPSARAFVGEIGHLIPGIRQLRDLAADGLFPGATQGLMSMETALPHVRGLISAVSTELGTLAEDAGASLASPKWTDFLDFLAKNAPQALGEMAQAAGNTAHAVAELWMATDPLNDDFSSWLVDATGRLDDFATGLSQTEGYNEFIAYVEENGPQVADTFGAIANAALQIIEATAPLGGPVLKGVEALSNLIADVADSDLGTPIFAGVGALALLNRTMAITASLQEKTFGGPALAKFRQSAAGIASLTADYRTLRAEQAKTRALTSNMVPIPLLKKGSAETERLTGKMKSLGKGAAAVAGLGIAVSGVADGLGLSNTASLALMGTIAGPWGAAIGGGVGLTLDLAHANDDLESAINRVNIAAKSGDFSAMDAGIKQLKGNIDDLKHTTGVGDFFSDQAKKYGSLLKNPGKPFASQAEQGKAEAAIADAKAAESAHKLDAANALLGEGYMATAAGAERAAQSTTDFDRSLQKLNETLTGRADMRDFEASLDDFTKSLKDNGKTLDINTEKGRNNQAALDAIASTALKVAGTLTGTKRATFLDAARADFVKAAQAAGMTRKAARALADEVLGLKNVTGRPRIVIDANGAWRVINDVQARLNQFKDKSIRLTVLANVSHAAAAISAVMDIHSSHAEGGTVPGPRYPYRDSVVTLLAGSEEVITNRHGEADQFRADRAAGRIPAYADGGRVGRAPEYSRSSWPAIDYERLAAAVTGNQLLGHRGTRDALLSAMRTALAEMPVQRAPRDPSLRYGVLT